MFKPVVIAIAGGSASGKTSIVEEVIDRLKEVVTVISADDYYKCLDEVSVEDRKKINYDHPDSYDNELFVSQLKDLVNGKSINKPLYDFKIHNRKKETELVTPNKIIIVEGILILHNKDIRDLSDIKIFVKCDEDLRFIRRMERDIKERGRNLDDVVSQYLKTVKPMFNQFIRPTIKYADIIIPNDEKHDVAVDMLVSRIKDLSK